MTNKPIIQEVPDTDEIIAKWLTDTLKPAAITHTGDTIVDVLDAVRKATYDRSGRAVAVAKGLLTILKGSAYLDEEPSDEIKLEKFVIEQIERMAKLQFAGKHGEAQDILQRYFGSYVVFEGAGRIPARPFVMSRIRADINASVYGNFAMPIVASQYLPEDYRMWIDGCDRYVYGVTPMALTDQNLINLKLLYKIYHAHDYVMQHVNELERVSREGDNINAFAVTLRELFDETLVLRQVIGEATVADKEAWIDRRDENFNCVVVWGSARKATVHGRTRFNAKDAANIVHLKACYAKMLLKAHREKVCSNSTSPQA